jgi:hypothetical protein
MNAQVNPWYLSRNGQQHGPFSDADVANFAKLGQLSTNDLIWRDGFENWRPALTIFPAPLPPSAQAPANRTMRAEGRGEPARKAKPPASRGLTLKRTLVALLSSAVIGAGCGYAFKHYLVNAETSLRWGQP